MVIENLGEPQFSFIVYPPDSLFYAGFIAEQDQRRGSMGGCAVQACLTISTERNKVYDRFVAQTLGPMTVPFYKARLNGARKHAKSNIQFHAESILGYRAPSEEADAVAL